MMKIANHNPFNMEKLCSIKVSAMDKGIIRDLKNLLNFDFTEMKYTVFQNEINYFCRVNDSWVRVIKE